ncbi:MAG: pyridoxal-phosphate dependent enzyme, partial [Limisphaerales bacterium]
MSNRLYVGNLPYSAVDASLVDHFSQAGTVVEAKVVNDRETGRSRGFGFVEMGSDEEAHKAIESATMRTPCVKAARLSLHLGIELYLKLENLQHTNAFKARGALNKLLTLTEEQKEKGV